MTATDILRIAGALFFLSIFAISVRLLWQELTREIEPYSKGD